MTRLWIRDPAAVLTDVQDPTAATRGLIVAGNRIDELVPAGADPMGGDSPPDMVFDATDCVVTPGLINTHHHFYQTLTRAHPSALNKELFDWLVGLYPVWAQLTPEMVSISSRTAMAELLLSGCTTTTDHHYVFPPGHEDAIDRQVAAAEELGIRAVLTRGSMDLSQKDGGLPPDSVVQDRDTILADCERLIDRFHDPAPDAQIQIALAPCSPFSVSRGLMEQTAALANARNVRCTRIWAKPKTKTPIAPKPWAADRWITWRPAVGSTNPAASGWPMVSISTPMRSRGLPAHKLAFPAAAIPT